MFNGKIGKKIVKIINDKNDYQTIENIIVLFDKKAQWTNYFTKELKLKTVMLYDPNEEIKKIYCNNDVKNIIDSFWDKMEILEEDLNDRREALSNDYQTGLSLLEDCIDESDIVDDFVLKFINKWKGNDKTEKLHVPITSEKFGLDVNNSINVLPTAENNNLYIINNISKNWKKDEFSKVIDIIKNGKNCLILEKVNSNIKFDDFVSLINGVRVEKIELTKTIYLVKIK